MTMPLITIGITCYREGDWLLECWESVLAQTDDRWEAVLVMDGGADERTQEIFAALDHPKLRKYTFTENVGCHPAHNKAFELTNTPYHFYLDGDDHLLPESVALVLETFARHPDAGFVYGDYEFFGGENTLIRYWPVDLLPDAVPFSSLMGGMAYVKAVWQQLGGFDLDFSRGRGDHAFHLSMAEAGIRGYHCNKVFYCYRENHEGRVSGSYPKQIFKKHELMVRRHPKLFADRGRRKRYLSVYYDEGALANYWDNEVKVASKLALKAIRCGRWYKKYLWAIMLAPYLPRHLKWLRQFWRGLHSLNNRTKRF